VDFEKLFWITLNQNLSLRCPPSKLSTLYTTLPHDKLKIRLKETIHKAFSHGGDGSKFVVVGYNSTYFSNKIQKGKTCYSKEQVISMLNIFVSFGGALFQQVVCIRIVPLF
jgi:hypothetical protein